MKQQPIVGWMTTPDYFMFVNEQPEGSFKWEFLDFKPTTGSEYAEFNRPIFIYHEKRSLEEKLQAQSDLLAKCEAALEYYADEKNWYNVNEHDKELPCIRMVIGSIDTYGNNWIGGRNAKLALTAIREWKEKTNE